MDMNASTGLSFETYELTNLSSQSSRVSFQDAVDECVDEKAQTKVLGVVSGMIRAVPRLQ
uniref:Uncharacterized protein n=1 Tax=Physcomitrium patens TaxID=3218 RepID=A0A2K1KC69_PHYPA|nr:hypothetical protein PHYPA_010558 [Physcomitrium patens]